MMTFIHQTIFHLKLFFHRAVCPYGTIVVDPPEGEEIKSITCDTCGKEF